MKRIATLFLTLSLLCSVCVPALAAESEPPEQEPPPIEQQDASTDTQPPEAGPAPITTIQELEAAIAAADSENTIVISNTILIDGMTLATDKALTLTTASDFSNSNLIELNNGAMISGFTFAYDGDCKAVYICNSTTAATVRNCSFDCASAVYVAGSTDGAPTMAYIEGCTFTNAKMSAVCVRTCADVQIESCTFSQNAATMQGGAVNNGGVLSISNSTITDNRAASGGGIFNSGTLTLSNTVIRSNTSINENFGADIFNLGTLALTDEQIEGAGYYEETTGAKVALPLSACSDTAKLVYLTDEEAAQRFPSSSTYPPAADTTPTTTPDTEQDKPTADTSTDTTQEPTPTPPPTTTTETPTTTEPTPRPPISRPSTRPTPERQETTQQEEPAHDTEQEKAPPLVCGKAVIDMNRSVVLYGYDDGLLHLEDSLTRGQMATIIYRLLDEDTLALYDTAETTFTDVPAEMWCCRYISTIAKAGIVAGTGNGCYAPNNKLTWAQILTVLSRFVEPQAYALQNIQYDGWAVEAVQTAVALGWIEDSADFAPNAIVSRGDFMQLVNGVLTLYRAV